MKWRSRGRSRCLVISSKRSSRISESLGHAQSQSVVGKSCIPCVDAVGDIGHAPPPVPFDGPRHAAGENIAPPAVKESRVSGNRVARASKAIACAKKIAYRHTFPPPSKRHHETRNLGDGVGDSPSHQILVGNRKYRLPDPRTERIDAVRI